MRYWWVSQNQTFEQEVTGGYMWSPKANKNGSLSHYYENMREVSRGDIIFSFKSRKIMAMGIALGPAYTCPKPTEFGSSGANWNHIGWRVEVKFHILQNSVQPSKHMELLRPLLSKRYSPIRPNGIGNQMYLAELSIEFAKNLMRLIGHEAMVIEQDSLQKESSIAELNPTSWENNPIIKKWDEVQIEKIQHDKILTVTERKQVIDSRRGQGWFRKRVAEREKYCRITHVDRPEHLIASHIKPWRVSDNKERLDGENGLFLTPTIDHLFNDGYISFRNNGGLIISPVAHRDPLIKMGVPTDKEFDCGTFTRQQAEYLEYHRDKILLKARG